jgi:UPF0271 protein
VNGTILSTLLEIDPPRMVLNIDAGEHEGESEELWGLADVLNVACGGHAGDDASMRRLVAFCTSAAVHAHDGRRPALGAHPAYPDRTGFGRASIAMSAVALEASVADQCDALESIARAANVPLRFVKPHGALYHDARERADVARAFLQGVIASLGWEVTVIGPPTGALATAADELGLRYAREGFADRAARPDGTLVPRGEAGALVTDPTVAAARASALAHEVDTICVHGDTPGAVAIARAVRAAIERTVRGTQGSAAQPWVPLGDRAVRLARPQGPSAAAIVRAVRAWPGVVDAVVTEAHVAAYFDAAPRVDATLVARLASAPEASRTPREITLASVYDGPDLDEVAHRAGVTPEDVARRHAAATYEVAMIGFLPGFAYLSGLDPSLEMPRRASPRPRVPAGSIGIGGRWTGVYPFVTPGGWSLIGRVVEGAMFGPEGARLALGDRVRFVP